MKKPFFQLTAYLLLTSSLLACSGSQDAVKRATDTNGNRNAMVADAVNGSGKVENQLNYDSEFAVAAASSGMLEVALGKLAQQKAIAQEVKDWGKTMETGHTQVNEQLMAIAGRAGIALPNRMSDDDRDHYDDVDDRKYFGFDKKFLRALKEAHERDIQRFSEASTKLSNAELRALAAAALPTLREHLQQTEQLYERANDRK